MENIKFTEIVGYLPHNLKFEADFWNNKFGSYEKINSVLSFENYKMVLEDYENVKFNVKPLSFLLKEIEHNGERFVPIDWLGFKYYPSLLKEEVLRLLKDKGRNWLYSSHVLVLHLYEWHFDIHGFNDRGLVKIF